MIRLPIQTFRSVRKCENEGDAKTSDYDRDFVYPIGVNDKTLGTSSSTIVSQVL